jgi:hypothetical protein
MRHRLSLGNDNAAVVAVAAVSFKVETCFIVCLRKSGKAIHFGFSLSLSCSFLSLYLLLNRKQIWRFSSSEKGKNCYSCMYPVPEGNNRFTSSPFLFLSLTYNMCINIFYTVHTYVHRVDVQSVCCGTPRHFL